MDPSEAGELAQDRAGWKGMILDRMKHLETFEEQKSHQYRFASEEEVLVRNAHRRASQVEEGFLCGVQGCNKRCKSKAGLTIHKRRMHERTRRVFKCSKCQKSFPAETNWINHEKVCGGPPKDRTSGGVTRAVRVSARTT